MFRYFLLFLFVQLLFPTANSAQKKLDSLLTVLKNSTEETEEKVDLIYKISGDYTRIHDNATAFLYADSSLLLAEQIDYDYGVRKAIHLKGLISKFQSKYEEAIEFYEVALDLNLKADDTLEIAGVYNNMGISYVRLGTYDKAHTNFFKALEYADKAKDQLMAAKIYNSIGNNYKNQTNFEKALEYHKKSLKIKREHNNRRDMASSYANIANVYKKLIEYEKASLYLDSALVIQREEDNLVGISNILSSKANMYGEMGDSQKALIHLQESVELDKIINRPNRSVSNHINIAICYHELKQYGKAIKHNKLALEIAKEIKAKDLMKYSYSGLRKAYEKQGKFELALEAHKNYSTMKDSMLNENTMNNINELEAKYNNLVNEKEIAELNEQALKDSLDMTVANNAVETLEMEAERSSVIQGLYTVLFVCILIVGVFVFRGYRNKIKANKEIQAQKSQVEHQKLTLEIKNKEITDSINYAKRIQSAILPSDKVVKEYLTNSFILFKPKDIVAGDFYWMEASTPLKKGDTEQSQSVLFAAADCTGHGVPGAMVSVICNNSLNRAVREYSLKEPGEILDKTRELVLKEFEKSENEMNDGMDIALCSLSVTDSSIKDTKNKELKETIATLQYAGAINPLWVIRNGSVIETKGNKQPIGKFDRPTPFTTHTFELKKDDTIYIFSDGYVDQFGGDKGKKLKSKAFKDLLISIQEKSMAEQKEAIDSAFEKWRGSLEQIDDVCIIGVRI